MGPRLMGPKEKGGLIELPCKAYTRRTGNMITCKTLWSESAHDNCVKAFWLNDRPSDY